MALGIERVLFYVFGMLTTLALPQAIDKAYAGDWSIDEARFGAAGSIQSDSAFEAGFFPNVVIFLDPLNSADAVDLREKMMRPRIHAGATISTTDEASFAFAGVNWTFDLTERLYLDFGLGGAIHNGKLHDNGQSGPSLGCAALFREYAAVGFRVTEKVHLLATVDHASNAGLCGENDGSSHAGLAVAYKF
ncbi:MAG: acyloxyacyl hydrolase [Rhizobium sp.]|nr:acyloxyacyl hydrolase [Rhizobium sp.]